jgi:hypothetical protein
MLILGALLLLVQAPAEPAPDSLRDDPAGERHQCLSVEVYPAREAPHRASAGHKQRWVFSASRSLDVIFRTELRRSLEGTHTVEFRVRAPRGFLYQSLAVPVTRAPKVKTRDGHAGLRPRPEITATFPVAGTAITNHSLYGRWTVEPLLDGAPCARARSFTLNP